MSSVRLAAIAASIAAAGVAVAAALVAARGGGPTLALADGAVELRGAPRGTAHDSAWAAALTLHVHDGAPRPPVISRIERRDGVVRLVPRFPLVPGVAYRARFDPRALGLTDTAIVLRFALPAPSIARTTRVAAVHPTAERVPENLLRWYVELTAPMETGEALAHVRLLDESGREVRGAFLTVGEELWDPERRRLTLLFDPGRVKRGIRTNVESGAPLVAGRRYRLTIDAAWRDGRGAPLASGWSRDLEATAADRRPPDVRDWRVAAPPAGTREPLRVAFDEPLDHALASRRLHVREVRAGGSVVAGAASLEPGDSVWRFVPDRPWRAGPHLLRAHASLEDLAGNSLARPYDADLRAGAISAERAAAAGEWRRVPFDVR